MATAPIDIPPGVSRLLNIQQVAAALQCCRPQVYRLVAAKRLAPPVRRGRRVFWLPEDVQAHVRDLAAQRGAA